MECGDFRTITRPDGSDCMLCTIAHGDPNKYPEERAIHTDCESSTVNGRMIDGDQRSRLSWR